MLAGRLSPLPGAENRLARLLDAESMRAIDRWAIEQRAIPSLELMEAAGAGLARLVGDLAPAGRVVVLCGAGNNGGDGLVAARLLRAGGREVDVHLLGQRGPAGDAGVNLQRLEGDAPSVGVPAPEALDGAAVVVDALLGTGSAGAPRAAVAEALTALASCTAPVVAADVPSGVDASTGEVAGLAVRAVATATFHAAKPGLWIAPGKWHAGRVEVVEIGIPTGAPERSQIGLIDPSIVTDVPRRTADSTKFTSGHVVVVGGSPGLTGAPCLTALAAMRAGAGYVTVAGPAALHGTFATRLLEPMTRALADRDGHLLPAAAGPVAELLDTHHGVLALGPGLGRSEGARELARTLACETPGPLVLDADGLNAHAGAIASLAGRSAPTVLTPHEGELARLLSRDASAVAACRLASAREAAAAARAIVVLKGDDTLVVDPTGRVAVSRGDAPALATAGTGDVLTGVVAALLAGGMEPFAAACAAVEAQRQAGRMAAAHGSREGVIASDVIAQLPGVWAGAGLSLA